MGIVDAWNASVRTRGTAADCGRRMRRIVRRVGDNAPKGGGDCGMVRSTVFRIVILV